MTRHCHACGTEYTLTGQPGRSETCEKCGADLHVCFNCVSHDPRAAQQCRDRRAELVMEKGAANYCEWFDFARRPWVPKAGSNRREAEAREKLKRLLGD